MYKHKHRLTKKISVFIKLWYIITYIPIHNYIYTAYNISIDIKVLINDIKYCLYKHFVSIWLPYTLVILTKISTNPKYSTYDKR